MDIKTIFHTRPPVIKREISRTKKTSPDRNTEGNNYTPVSQNDIEGNEQEKETPEKKEAHLAKVNEEVLDVSKLLGSIELQRSFNEKIK